MDRRPRLVAVGDALADIVVAAGPGDCEALGVAPGTAAFRDRAALEAAVARLAGGGPVAPTAGGSAANTCVAFAASGGHASLLTASMTDDLGRSIAEDLAARGVRVPLPRGGRATTRASGPVGAVSAFAATGRCLVLLLPDGERAFLIWQGEPWRLRALREAVAAYFARDEPCDALLFEGYLLAADEGLEVARSVLARARAVGAARVLALSDQRLVLEHRRRFEAVLAAGVDVVVGNEAEATAVTGRATARDAAAELARRGALAVVTLGRRGALVHGPAGRHLVTGAEIVPAPSALGAGDAFAGGFLFGLLSGAEHSVCLALGTGRARAVLKVRQARAPVRGPTGGAPPMTSAGEIP
ncbi:carbohydrate kinase family protein [Streptomyces varsoviensis]|uniref:carbohydrate kinase family protein n=1 Tax=Streptomyces varsoviensis TaxID=67373 RepID=UPI0033DCEE63